MHVGLSPSKAANAGHVMYLSADVVQQRPVVPDRHQRVGRDCAAGRDRRDANAREGGVPAAHQAACPATTAR